MKRIGRKRGISLIMALFTTAVLFSLAIAFLALAIGEARTSRSASYSTVAQNAANWGVEYTLNYMGRGGNWTTQFEPGSLVVFDVLHAISPNGNQHLASAEGAYTVQITANSEGNDANQRLLQITGPNPDGSTLVIGDPADPDRLLAQVEVSVAPVRVTGFVGQQPQYNLISTARILRPGETEPLASRVIEVRVRQKPEISDLIHVQNMRSWDAQGVGVGHPQMSDRIFIPSVYRTDGTVRVTGTDPLVPGAPWRDQAGNLRFQNPDSEDLAFEGPLFINRLGNLGPSGNTFAPPDLAAYQGPVSFGSDFVPLPDVSFYLNRDKNGDGVIQNAGSLSGFSLADAGEERGLLYAASLDNTGDAVPEGPLVRGYFGVDRGLVETAHQRHPRVPVAGGPPVVLQDYRPPVPEVEIVLMDGGMIQVNYWEVTHGDGGITNSDGSLNDVAVNRPLNGPVGQPFHFSQLKHGTIYVEGGNTVVRSELSGGEAAEFEGRLTIVAAEDNTRRRTDDGSGSAAYANVNGSIYHQAAREFFDLMKTRAQLPSDHPDYVPNDATFPSPPYSGSTLVAAANSGLIQANVGGLATDETLFWPPPALPVEREGNLVIGGDLRKAENANAVVGLNAENFILLNDRTITIKQNPTELVVDAVFMSFEHSVQLDWDNTGNNRVIINGTTDAHDVITAPGHNGNFVYNGSLISAFSDVEGDVTGKGYPNQDFEHDRDLLNFSPPFQPRSLLASYPNTQIAIEWQIKQYADRGSLNTYLSN